jgi:hypothetical protein
MGKPLFVRDRTTKVIPQSTTTDARQGVTGHNVRYVLAWSAGLAIAAMGILFVAAIYFGASF